MIEMDDVKYKNISQCLDGYWEKPWTELPEEQRQAWNLALGPIRGDDDKDGKEWDGRDAKAIIAANYDAVHDPAFKSARLVGWYDFTIDAKTWFDMENIKPKEAAMLMCQISPLDDVDPELIFVDDDKTSPDRYRLLLRVFEDKLSVSPEPRTLKQWRSIAQELGLRYHSWIDEYLQAIGITDDTASDLTATAEAAPELGTKTLNSSKIADIVGDEQVKTLADLFDPVTKEILEKMFPARGKWKSWAEHAKDNGLIKARKQRKLFNPYLAALWFLQRGVDDWDLARCNRVLANNLPERSKDEAYKLTGDLK